MKGKKQIFVVALAASMMISTAAHADVIQTDQQKIQDLQSSLHSANTKLNQAQQKKDQYDAQVNQLQEALGVVQNKINTNQQEIDAKTKQVQELDGQIKQNETELEQTQAVFDKQIRAMYEHGNVSYLSVLLNASSFDDFLNRFDDMTMVADENNKLMQKIKQLKQQLSDQQAQVQKDLQSAQQKQQELAVLNQTYRTMQAQEQQQADAAQKQVNSAQSDASELQHELDFAKQELLYAQQHPIVETGPSIAAHTATVKYSGSTNQIVSYAEQFMGTPYVWGGTQPGGFDCSGFTQYVFEHFGIPLSRTSQSQFTEGVSVSDLQPGDLVFFSTYGPGATHVGIYIGSGLMVNAEDNGVRVDNIHNPYYWGPRYIGARRIVK